MIEIALLAAAAFVATWVMVPKIELALMTPEERIATETSVYYAGCDEVRALGMDPLYAGQPGYRSGMDGDGDGIACEPYY